MGSSGNFGETGIVGGSKLRELAFGGVLLIFTLLPELNASSPLSPYNHDGLKT